MTPNAWNKKRPNVKFCFHPDRKAKIRIPELSSDLLSFKAFLQSQVHFPLIKVERINPEQAQRAYDKYKKDWEEKQCEIFLDKYRVALYNDLG